MGIKTSMNWKFKEPRTLVTLNKPGNLDNKILEQLRALVEGRVSSEEPFTLMFLPDVGVEVFENVTPAKDCYYICDYYNCDELAKFPYVTKEHNIWYYCKKHYEQMSESPESSEDKQSVHAPLRERVKIHAVRKPDEKWAQMKKVWHACKQAGVEVPSEVEGFFGGCEPRDDGVFGEIVYGVEKFYGTPQCTREEHHVYTVYEVFLSGLPDGAESITITVPDESADAGDVS